MDKILRECKKHGMTEFYIWRDKTRDRNSYKCRTCNVEAVTRRRKKLKKMAIEHMGSKCHKCNISFEHQSVYEFHHLDPNSKDFGIGAKGHTISWERMKVELAKCIMVCANCHRIIHANNTGC